MPEPEPPEPSKFFLAETQRLESVAAHAPILDLACGRGRHSLASAALGIPTVALDRSPDFLSALDARARSANLPLRCLRADLESGFGLPLKPESFSALLVFRYLWRPLCPKLGGLLRPGGWLLYETFTVRQRAWNSGPRNPNFLLAEGELATLFPDLRVHRFEESAGSEAEPAALARLLAQRPPP